MNQFGLYRSKIVSHALTELELGSHDKGLRDWKLIYKVVM